VDRLIAGDQRACHIAIAVEEGGGGGGEALGDHVEQPEDMLIDVCNCYPRQDAPSVAPPAVAFEITSDPTNPSLCLTSGANLWISRSITLLPFESRTTDLRNSARRGSTARTPRLARGGSPSARPLSQTEPTARARPVAPRVLP